MKVAISRALAIGGLIAAGGIVLADGTRFSAFTPLAASAGPTANEAAPITLSNPAFSQRSVADRVTQLAETTRTRAAGT